jgi:hypothetical protein
MRTRRPLAALASLFLVASLAVPAIAFADETGSAGSVKKIEVNTPSADTYLSYHGRVFVLTGKTTQTEYRWGGTSCGTRTVGAEMVQILVEASRNTDLVVTPVFQLGQADIKCLVGFTVNKKR